MKIDEILSKIEADKKNMEFLKTGFSRLDEFLDGGFLRKELIVLGGATGKGKSFIAGTIFAHVASQGFNTAYISLEISNEMIVSRLIGQKANIKPTRIMAGLLTKTENDAKIKAKAELKMWDEFLTFHDDLYKIEEIEKLIQENEYEFVVIDFVQNILGGLGSSENERLANISLTLQKLAKEKNCCILVLSQLSNQIARDGTKATEYKGSGAIATAADLGFFIVREEVSSITAGENAFSVELRKNRRGISGVKFDFRFTQPGGGIVSL